MKQVLQYLWIEKYSCIEKAEFNFTRRSAIHYDDNNRMLSIKNNENYCNDFFGKNVEISCIVGKNGSGKTSLLEFIMHIADNKPVVSNFIIAIYENDSLVIYHTGIVKECNGKTKTIHKNDEGAFLLGNAIDSDIVYYTYAFNYNQFNQKYTKVNNYSPACILTKNSDYIKNEHGETELLTNISKSYIWAMRNQLDFICNYKGIWKDFGIRKPLRMKINLQNTRKNALLDFGIKFHSIKENSLKEMELLLEKSPDSAEKYKKRYRECIEIESEFDINDLCENFFDCKW